MKQKCLITTLALAGLCITSMPQLRAGDSKKEEAIAIIESQRDALIDLSDRIWTYAETALKETKSSKALADYAEQQGFEVERGVAGMPTAFMASYGKGSPIIGIMGEYDALPGLSQKPTSVKEAHEPGAAGHGCGHNLFGAGSLGAAIGIKELIEAGKLTGTIRFYGTPAEESVGGKIYMVREGLFDDLDVCLSWHPNSKIKADVQSSQALVDFIVEFHGKASHAAFDPWNGRSAVDGLELFTDGLNMLREHVKPSVRMHYAIVNGGDVPNVVPEYAKLWCWVRDSKRDGVETVLNRVRDIAKGAGLMAGVESKLSIISGDYEMLVNITGEKLIYKNLQWLGPIEYSEEEQEFARTIQRAVGIEETGLNGEVQPMEKPKEDPPGGSTDVGDVSWVVPTLQLEVTTAPENSPWHAWPVVACGGNSIGQKGMIYAAKALAISMVDLFENEEARQAIKAEFNEKRGDHVYQPYIPDGPPPLPETSH